MIKLEAKFDSGVWENFGKMKKNRGFEGCISAARLNEKFKA